MTDSDMLELLRAGDLRRRVRVVRRLVYEGPASWAITTLERSATVGKTLEPGVGLMSTDRGVSGTTESVEDIHD